MCMVSNIGDSFGDMYPKKWPNYFPVPDSVDQFARNELAALRKEMEELKNLLEAAKRFDEETGQPDCHMDEKVKLIKAIAKLVGVDLGDVFGKESKK